MQNSKPLIKDEEKNQYTFKPLIKQVCENVIKTNPSLNSTDALQDIEYRNSSSEGFKDLFKSFKIGYTKLKH